MHQVGQSLCYWILNAKGTYIARSTVIPISEEQLTDIKERLIAFSVSVHDTIGNNKKAIIRGEDLNEDDLYYDTFFDRRAEIEV